MPLNRNAFRTREQSAAARLAGNSQSYRGPDVDVKPAIPLDCKRCNIRSERGQGWCIGPRLPWRHHDE